MHGNYFYTRPTIHFPLQHMMVNTIVAYRRNEDITSTTLPFILLEILSVLYDITS
jgi:hypothetical protein